MEPNGHTFEAFAIPVKYDRWDIKNYPKSFQELDKLEYWKGLAYNTSWYGKQLPRHPFKKRFLQRLTYKFTDKYVLPSHITERSIVIKNCPEKVREDLLSQEGVAAIDMPKNFKPF